MRLALFDLDGVLVLPGGYRAALRATVARVTRALGIDPPPSLLDEPTIQAFEALGITSEWDIAPICVAALSNAAWSAGRAVTLPEAFDAEPVDLFLLPEPPDLAVVARRVAQARQPGELVCDAALRLFLSEFEGTTPETRAGRQRELTRLLGHSRTFPDSPALFVFQHYSLGSRGFQQAYGISPAFETPSMIELHDQPALEETWRERLLAMIAAGELRAAMFTLRPSLGPRTATGQVGGAAPASPNPVQAPGASDLPPAPEAELAVGLLGLSDLPLIGYGRLQWLAAVAGGHAEQFVKPSPVHALAAMLAAMSGDEAASLRAAHALAEGKPSAALRLLNEAALAVDVFEDSPIGIESVRRAVAMLRLAGVDVVFRAWGIASGTEKVRALRAAEARVVETLEEALGEALVMGN